MSEFHAHHLGIGPDDVAGNGGRGRVFFVPGSAGRARRFADRFEGVREVQNPRAHSVWLGTLEIDGTRVDAGATATGMGCPTVSIIVTELLALGVRRLIRVGTAGSLQPEAVRCGDLVIATAGVRDEASSDVFCPRDVPALAHPDWVTALRVASDRMGLADHTFAGPVHTKDVLYGREFPTGPLAEASRTYMAMLRAMGVVATEMETSHLFVLASAHGPDLTPVSTCTASPTVVKAGSLLAIIGDESGFGPEDVAKATEQQAIDVACAGAVELFRMEGT